MHFSVDALKTENIVQLSYVKYLELPYVKLLALVKQVDAQLKVALMHKICYFTVLAHVDYENTLLRGKGIPVE